MRELGRFPAGVYTLGLTPATLETVGIGSVDINASLNVRLSTQSEVNDSYVVLSENKNTRPSFNYHSMTKYPLGGKLDTDDEIYTEIV